MLREATVTLRMRYLLSYFLVRVILLIRREPKAVGGFRTTAHWLIDSEDTFPSGLMPSLDSSFPTFLPWLAAHLFAGRIVSFARGPSISVDGIPHRADRVRPRPARIRRHVSSYGTDTDQGGREPAKGCRFNTHKELPRQHKTRHSRHGTRRKLSPRASRTSTHRGRTPETEESTT